VGKRGYTNMPQAETELKTSVLESPVKNYYSRPTGEVSELKN
jgi:hypothetical protein